MSRWGCLIALLVQATALVASAGDGPHKLAPANFREGLQQAVDVSTSTIVGVMRGSHYSNYTQGAPLRFRLPESPAGTICVDVTTRDGRYQATLTAKRTPTEGGVYELDFPTKHAADLADDDDWDVVPLVRLHSADTGTVRDCAGAARRILPASWGDPPDDDGVTILVNSGRYETAVVVEKGETQTRLPCASVQGDTLVQFDRRCTIDAASLAGGVVRVEREKGFSRLPSVRVLLGE